jgi:hypothetical protein
MRLAFLETRRNWHRASCDTEIRVNTAARVTVRATIEGDYLLLKNRACLETWECQVLEIKLSVLDARGAFTQVSASISQGSIHDFSDKPGFFCLSPNHRKPGFSIEPANKFLGCPASLLGEPRASYPVNWDTPHLISEVSSRQKLCVTLRGRRTLLTALLFPPPARGKTGVRSTRVVD